MKGLFSPVVSGPISEAPFPPGIRPMVASVTTTVPAPIPLTISVLIPLEIPISTGWAMNEFPSRSKSAYFPVFGRKKARQKRPFKNGQTFPLLGGRFNCSDEFSVQSRYRNAGPTGKQAAKRRAAGASRPVHNGQRAPAPLRYAAGRTGRNESHGRRRSRCRCSRGRHD